MDTPNNPFFPLLPHRLAQFRRSRPYIPHKSSSFVRQLADYSGDNPLNHPFLTDLPSSGVFLDSTLKKTAVSFFQNLSHASAAPEITTNNIALKNGRLNTYSFLLHALKEQGILNNHDAVLTPFPSHQNWNSTSNDTGIEISGIPTKPENNYRLTAEELETAILRTNAKLKNIYGSENADDQAPRVKLFVLANPSVPAGTVYGQKEIEEFAAILKKYDIRAIDDMTYKELEHDRSAPAYAFAAVEGMFERTVSLAGASNTYCLPEFDAEIICGSAPLIRSLNAAFKSVCPAFQKDEQFKALNSLFSSDKHFQQPKEAYLNSNSKEYFLKRLVWKALVDGISAWPEFYRHNVKSIISEFCSTPEELQVLLNGLPYIKTLGTPEAGFYQALDVSQMRGLKKLDSQEKLGSASDIAGHLLDIAKVKFSTGDQFYWPDGKFMLQSNFSSSIYEMVKGVKILHAALQKITDWNQNVSPEKKEAVHRQWVHGAQDLSPKEQDTVYRRIISKKYLNDSQYISPFQKANSTIPVIDFYHIMQGVRKGAAALVSDWTEKKLPDWMLNLSESVSSANYPEIDRMVFRKHTWSALHQVIRDSSKDMIEDLKKIAEDKENKLLKIAAHIAGDVNAAAWDALKASKAAVLPHKHFTNIKTEILFGKGWQPFVSHEGRAPIDSLDEEILRRIHKSPQEAYDKYLHKQIEDQVLTEIALKDGKVQAAMKKLKGILYNDLTKNEAYSELFSGLSDSDANKVIILGRRIGRICFAAKRGLYDPFNIALRNEIIQPNDSFEDIGSGPRVGEFFEAVCSELDTSTFNFTKYGIKKQAVAKAVQFTMQPLLLLRLAEAIRSSPNNSHPDGETANPILKKLDMAINGLHKYFEIDNTPIIHSGKDIALLMGCMASHIRNDATKQYIMNVAKDLASIDNNTELRKYLNSKDVQFSFDQLCDEYFQEANIPQWDSGKKAIRIINEALKEPHAIHVETRDAILAKLKFDSSLTLQISNTLKISSHLRSLNEIDRHLRKPASKYLSESGTSR